MPEKLDSDGLPNKDVANKANNTTLLAYNKTPIKCYGIFDLQCDYERGDWKTFQFHNVDVPSPAVCGLPLAEALGLITLHRSVDVLTPQQRRERDTLPSKIRNSDPVQEDIRQQLTSRQPEQKDYHNRSMKELPPLIPGQRALYQDLQSGRWAPANVVTRAPEPRSYVIQTESGQTMRCNRVQLRGRILNTTGPPPSPPRREVARPNLVPNPPTGVTNQPVPAGSGDSSSKGQMCKDNAPVTVSSPKPSPIVLRSGRKVRIPARL